ncbi:autotransporter outer membrane beta-barrel domain-containing protein [Mesorhizobium huakuii]|uniref:autotransporter outer membrane beta-barrel domain-containing protein n=1 Tax=Mesorhizobium huakuii TaxID=28104 RepID=UPI001FD24AB3|nr:autotransporter outer membrane beta-barrel domain-containing protein [Mesorhizobium huakuii]
MQQNMFGSRKASLTFVAPTSYLNLRDNLRSQASRLALRSAIGIATAAGVSLLAPAQAWADCLVGATTVQCDTTSTTDTTFPANAPSDRAYQGLLPVPVDVTVDAGTTISGNGLAVTNTGTGGVTVTNNGTISVDTGNTPTAGGTAALSISAAGGAITYTGGNIINHGAGNAFDVSQTAGAGSVSINVSGNIFSATGEGIVIRDVATSTGISVTTNDVTALTAGKDAIDAQSQSLTGNVVEVANGNLQAGNAGMVAAILNAAATGNIDVTANGSLDARFGIDAENFGSGSTSVTTVGPVNVTTGNGIFALSTGGNVIVNAGDVTSTGNTAIIAQQTKVAGTGLIGVTAGNVSGTTGIDAHNFGTGDIGIVANGTVTGTAAEGIKAVGNAGVFVSVNQTVTGATLGLSLVGGTGGTGNISVTGTGGFVGGSGDAANILNNGSGTVTVDISGASSSTGGEGIFVRDVATSTGISVTTGAVTALTAGKDAIDVQSQSLTGNVIEVANGNLQAGNAGMVAAILNAAATGYISVTANGSLDARFGIDAENFGSGSTSVITVGPVTATTGNGIFALTTGGTAVVIAGDVTSTGNTAIIAQQTKVAGTGLIDVTAGNVSGTTGIDAHNFGTGATSVTANGTVTGTLAEGIKATGNGAVSVSVADTVTGATRGLSLVGGTGGTGNISVTGTGGFVGGSGDAANILNNGSGTVTVDISGASSSTGGEGIFVRDVATSTGISVTTGAVTALTAGKDAIDVQSQSLTGNVIEVANGNLQAGNAGMVAAILNAAATGYISVTANGSLDARFGIDAENFGSGSTSVITVGPVTATTGNGIFALTTGGTAVVIAGDVTSTGNTAIIAQQTKVAGTGLIDVTAGNVSGTTGIDAHNFGTGATSVTANGTVTGTLAEGIKATGNGAVSVSVADTVTGATRGLSLVGGTGGSGDISVTGTGGFVGGSGDAANILNGGSGTVTVDISGASSSTGGEGIFVRDTSAGGKISVTTGAVTALTAGKDGIDVQSHSVIGNITEVANGDIKAGNAGMVAAFLNAAAVGNIDVTANGSIDARFGIDAENFGSGSTKVTTVGPVTTTNGNGIFARSSGGDVTVNAGDVTSTGNTAIVARQTGVGAIAITTSGTVEGSLAAIDAQSNAGHAIGITLSGATHNSAQTATALAIVTAGGATTLTNDGALLGRVTLGDFVDKVTNNATWTTGGTSQFGAGFDSLINAASATLVTASIGASLETTTFSGLESLSNSGLLTMQDGGAGDRTLVSGNVTLAAGSTYAIDIGGAQSDLLHASGTADITGSTLAVNIQGGLQFGSHYTVLTADLGLAGHFADVTGITNTAFLSVIDTYDFNNAYLDVLKTQTFADAGLTPNQIATGQGLDSIPASGSLFNAVAGLATDAEARAAFDQLSGEIHASAKGMLVEDSSFIRDAASNRIAAAFGDAGAAALPVMAYGEGGPEMVAADTDRFAVWGQAFGSWGNTDSDGNAAAFDRSTGGLLAGADTLVGGWRVGLLGGYSHSSFNADDRNSSGKSDNYHLGLYGGTNWGAIAFRTGAAYSWSSLSTHRSVAFNGFADALSAHYDAGTAQVFGELAYKADAGRFKFEPFANLAYVSVHTDGFTETGGAAALTSAGSTTDATFTTLGLRGSTDFALGGIDATARGTLGWRHAFGDVTPTSSFAFAGGNAFTIAGVPIARDSAIIEAGIDMKMSPNATLGLSYTGQFGGGTVDNGARANLSVKF